MGRMGSVIVPLVSSHIDILYKRFILNLSIRGLFISLLSDILGRYFKFYSQNSLI